MSNRELEIAPAEYYVFIIDLLSCNDGVIPTSEVYEAIESFFGTKFSAADQRLMKLPNGKKRPKWKNNVDWAKATGSINGDLATVAHKKKRWLILLDEADDFWVEKAARKKKRNCFKKKCPGCDSWLALNAAACPNCDHVFPPTPKKRSIEF